MPGQNDYLGNKELAKQGVLDGNLSYYVVSRPHLMTYANSLETNDIVIIPPVDDIISCYFYPYMDLGNMLTVEVDYDEEAYPLPYNENAVENLTLTKIKHISGNGIKDVGTFSKYCVSGTDIGGTWKWQNEGKLWLPPFTTCTAYDGLSEPMEINPSLLPDGDNFTLCVRHSLNHLGAYTLYIDGYRGSSQGYLYGQTCTGLSFPIVSNAYTSFMHDNQFNLKNHRYQIATNCISGIGSSLMKGDVSQLLSTITNTLGEVGSYHVPIAQAKLSGYQLSGEGSNALHDIQFLGGMQVFYQQYLDRYMNEIGSYFHRYGYAQNKLMTPNINSRKYFNYLKGEVIIQSSTVPPEYMKELIGQFYEGATIWHLSTSNNFIGNYLPDNIEI